MKICFFHFKAYAIFDSKSDAPIGGTLVQLHVLAQKLAEDAQNEVSFLVGDFGQPPLETYGSIRVYRSVKLRRTPWNMIKSIFSLWRDLGKVDADVYVTSSASPEVGLLVLFGRMRKKKIIYRVAHEWDCSGEYVKKNGLLGKAFEWGLKHAHAVVLQSHEQYALLRERYSKEGAVIPNSYFINDFQDTPKDGVLWVSRCEKWKHPEAFLRLAESLPQLSFTMICPKQKYQEAYHEQIRQAASLLKNLHFIDFIPFDEIQSYFNSSRVFVGTSEYEGFPNTYIQACMGKTPIVSLKVNPDNFIQKFNLGYVAEGDEKKLQEYTSRLLSDKTAWEEKAENAFHYIQEVHDIEKNIAKWQDLMRKNI